MNALLEKEDTLRYVDIADAMMMEYNMPWFNRRDVQQRLRSHFREAYMAGVYIGILTAVCARGYAILFRRLRNAWFIICDDVVLGDCLVAALQHDHLELADALVADPDTNTRDAFIVAVMRGHTDIAEDIYIRADDRDFDMREAMTAAITQNNLRSVRYVFEKYPYIHEEHFAAAAQGVKRWDVLHFLLMQEDAVPTDMALAAAISTNNGRAVEAIWQHENFADHNTRPWLVLAAKHVHIYKWLWKHAAPHPKRLVATLFYFGTPETTVFTLRNMKEYEWTQSGLMKELTATHGSADVLKVLVSDPRFVKKPQYLVKAAKKNAAAVIRELIPFTDSGHTEAAKEAMKQSNVDIVDMLMHYVQKEVLLQQAVYSRSTRIVEITLKQQKNIIGDWHMIHGLEAVVFDGDDPGMLQLLLNVTSDHVFKQQTDHLINYMHTLERPTLLAAFLRYPRVHVSHEDAQYYLKHIVDSDSPMYDVWRRYLQKTNPYMN